MNIVYDRFIFHNIVPCTFLPHKFYFLVDMYFYEATDTPLLVCRVVYCICSLRRTSAAAPVNLDLHMIAGIIIGARKDDNARIHTNDLRISVKRSYVLNYPRLAVKFCI